MQKQKPPAFNPLWFVWSFVILITAIVVMNLNWGSIARSTRSPARTAPPHPTLGKRIPGEVEWIIGFREGGEMQARYGRGTVTRDTIKIAYVAYVARDRKKRKEYYRGVIEAGSSDGGKTYNGYFRWAKSAKDGLKFEKLGHRTYISYYEGIEGKTWIAFSQAIYPPGERRFPERWVYNSTAQKSRQQQIYKGYGRATSDTLTLFFKIPDTLGWSGELDEWLEVTGHSTDGGETFNCFVRSIWGYVNLTVRRISPGAYKGKWGTFNDGREILLTRE